MPNGTVPMCGPGFRLIKLLNIVRNKFMALRFGKTYLFTRHFSHKEKNNVELQTKPFRTITTSVRRTHNPPIRRRRCVNVNTATLSRIKKSADVRLFGASGAANEANICLFETRSAGSNRAPQRACPSGAGDFH